MLWSAVTLNIVYCLSRLKHIIACSSFWGARHPVYAVETCEPTVFLCCRSCWVDFWATLLARTTAAVDLALPLDAAVGLASSSSRNNSATSSYCHNRQQTTQRFSRSCSLMQRRLQPAYKPCRKCSTIKVGEWAVQGISSKVSTQNINSRQKYFSSVITNNLASLACFQTLFWPRMSKNWRRLGLCFTELTRCRS